MKLSIATAIILGAASWAASASAVTSSRPSVENHLAMLENLRWHYSAESGLTGCYQLGDRSSLVCFEWMLGNRFTTCLQWGEAAAVAACIQRGRSNLRDSAPVIEIRQGTDILPMQRDRSWGYRVDLILETVVQR